MNVGQRSGFLFAGAIPETRSGALFSFDFLRVAAMAAIVYQHLLPIYRLSPQCGLPLDVGQLGVAIFCGMSGYFAFRSHPSSDRSWLATRLKKILPAYWIALTVAFAANAIIHYKPAGFRVVALQYLGLAAFLDGSQRIGQPYWFITLILVCYATAAFLRRRPRAIPLAAAAALLLVRVDLWVSIHVISFLACGAVSVWRTAWLGPALTLIAGLTAATLFHAMIYPLIALVSVQVAMLCPWGSGRGARLTGRLTYEFFLVHGMVYLGLAVGLGVGFLPNLVFGTTISALVAYLLHRLTATLVEMVSSEAVQVPWGGRASSGPASPGRSGLAEGWESIRIPSQDGLRSTSSRDR